MLQWLRRDPARPRVKAGANPQPRALSRVNPRCYRQKSTCKASRSQNREVGQNVPFSKPAVGQLRAILAHKYAKSRARAKPLIKFGGLLDGMGFQPAEPWCEFGLKLSQILSINNKHAHVAKLCGV
jgi:hypothetical protein